jgi:hypothetical protein
VLEIDGPVLRSRVSLRQGNHELFAREEHAFQGRKGGRDICEACIDPVLLECLKLRLRVEFTKFDDNPGKTRTKRRLKGAF